MLDAESLAHEAACSVGTICGVSRQRYVLLHEGLPGCKDCRKILVVLGVEGGAGGRAVHCSPSLCCMRGIKERHAWPNVYVPALCMYCCAQLEVDWWWCEGARLVACGFLACLCTSAFADEAA